MATKQKEAPKSKAPANDGSYWSLCAKRGCGKSVKLAPVNIDKRTGKAYHPDHQPKGFVASGTGIEPKGYVSIKLGSAKTEKQMEAAANKRKPKAAPKKRAPKKAAKAAA